MKALLILFILFLSVLGRAELSESRFNQLHQDVQPKPGEDWSTIEWQTSLIKAQNMAVDAKKPLFIWAMDGHPVGCV